MRMNRLPLFPVVLVMGSWSAAAQVYQCEQANGVMSFQSLPCSNDSSKELEPQGCPLPEWLALKSGGDCGDLKLLRYEAVYRRPMPRNQRGGRASQALVYDTCADVVFFACDGVASYSDVTALARRFLLRLDSGSLLEGHWMKIANPDSTTNVFESRTCFGCPDCDLRMIRDIECR